MVMALEIVHGEDAVTPEASLDESEPSHRLLDPVLAEVPLDLVEHPEAVPEPLRRFLGELAPREGGFLDLELGELLAVRRDHEPDSFSVHDFPPHGWQCYTDETEGFSIF